MTLSELAHSKLLMAQRIYRLAQTSKFAEAENAANPDERARMESCIQEGNISGLEGIVYELTKNNLEYRYTRDLRVIAEAYRIKNARAITREQLIEEIRRAKDDSKGGD